MGLKLLHKKLLLWLVLFFSFELAVACPVYQIVQHVELITLFSDDSNDDHSHDEEEVCVFCFNKNASILSSDTHQSFANPVIGLFYTYRAVESDTTKRLYTIRPPPILLS